MRNSRLFIVSNRLPMTITCEEDNVNVRPSAGGLITAMDSYLKTDSSVFEETYWVGYAGCTPLVWEKAIRSATKSNFTYLPVFIHDEQYEKYYNGFSNSVVWPLFHYFPSFAEYNLDHFDHYLLANEQFSEAIAKHLRPGDTVWIHDYHLMPLAQMLRNIIPDITIGFFLHIPFPSHELFRLLPRSWQEQLLKGMLGADLIGFHTIDYATHFLQSVLAVLGLDNDRHILRHDNRLVKVDVFPISIDFSHFHNAYESEEVIQRRSSLKSKMVGQKLIFSVDRLDYTKGVFNRLKAYQLFLKRNPKYRNKVVFVLVIVPSRDTIGKYAERKRMIDELVSQLNGELGGLHWQPVIYRYSSLSFEEMMALYTACDLALITPLRDGMNLVAKEFVASRKDKQGVLVISEMAGAARELTDALTINPNDLLEMSQAIKEGLEMGEQEQRYRMENMQRRVANYNVQTWADDFATEMKTIKKRQESFQIFFMDNQSKRLLLDSYRKSEKRLLLLDYDGTLVPHVGDPEKAVPGHELLHLLRELASNEKNEVLLISGRSSTWLDKHFKDLPISLIAEHGARSKQKNGDWVTEIQTHSEWKEQVHNMMEMYVRRCANSFIEEKDFSIVWHYRNSTIEQGKLRSLELISELNEYIHNRHLQVLPGNKIVEVRNSGIDKGTAVKKILQNGNYDFIFAVGDDKTDEDMFKLLMDKQHCFSIKVGPDASFAKFNLHTPQMVVSLLEGMSHLLTESGVTSLSER
ncbi:MAG: bifunctional alpha,alpha-trehalose-phosphate synthase (UDP-forming)/trehalose-phosphatase [Chitinophagaceae bacterium]|nr:MAG: bifunctional alpha,alpha-trehalose-phosphate synthase (UDP-forming)/trehalose-phosphatase [Chitinophagaceae bacterium]